MGILWQNLEAKLNKSGRKWAESPDFLPHICAELFCKECGKSLGIWNICTNNLETIVYCTNCVSKYIKDTPFTIDCGVITQDIGTNVELEYKDNYYTLMRINKVCYFNSKGRYIKVKGKRYYI